MSSRELGDGLIAVVATKMRGVLGEVQERIDPVLVEQHGEERARRLAAVAKAQAELDQAGEEANPKDASYALAWAWQRLDEALMRLAQLEARHRLAVRREALKQQSELDKQRGRP